MLGNRLAMLRKQMNLSQQDLANALSISFSAVSAYERGINEPDDDLKVKIAKMFNVSLDYLCGITDARITLNRTNIIDLPIGFPEDMKVEVSKYINYLMYLHENKV